MASMPHITVKVDSSQVQGLIEIADQLRRMSDDLREVIRNVTVEHKHADAAESSPRLVYPHSEFLFNDPPDWTFTHNKNAPIDDAPDDQYGIDKSASGDCFLTAKDLEIAGRLNESFYTGDPDAIQDAP